MKVGIISLGCKVNIYESEYVISKLLNHGYEIVPFNSNADIYIINTCTVTNTSDKKSEKMIRQARKNKNAIVVVMGCHSQIKSDQIDADIIIGNKDKSRVVELIEEFIKNKTKIKRIYDLTNTSFENMEIKTFTTHTRAFVKIQDGCDAFCSYCIIPYSRGNVRSKDKDLVIKEVTNLVNKGYKEIVLTGIHTGKYGKDINCSLYFLLSELVKIPNLYRLRISSIEINEITDEIIDLIKNNNIIARHLHIPLQSGSDTILELMNRKYDTAFYLNKIKYIRSKIKDISITTDLIVGFPNENDKLFNETIDFIKKVGFTKIHTFPYSKRENTISASMKNEIDENTKKKRVKEVILLSNTLENTFYQKHIDNEYEIITETVKDNHTRGYTTNYIPCIINENLKTNEIITVKIEKIENNLAYAKKIK